MKIIGITGGSGSGKTYLANHLIDKFGDSNINLIQLDSYYKDLKNLPMDQREINNFDHPNAFDFNLLHKHLNTLTYKNKIDIPIYDYKTHTRKIDTFLLNKKPILLIEGIFSIYSKKLRDIIDYKVYLDIKEEIRKERRIIRDKKHRGRTHKSILKQYQNTVHPMYIKYIKPMKKYSDLIIKENSNNGIEFHKLVSYIESTLNNIL